MIGFNYRPLLPRIHHCQRKFAHQATFARDERWPGYQVVIGIEVHAQIKARQKLFSEERTSVNETPNTRVSLFDDAFPGTLPTLNPKCVELAVRTALALNSNIQQRSAFDRKHYFYSDIPAGYQITQNYAPLAKGGSIEIASSFDASPKSVRIKQIQLEQDTAKSTANAFKNLTRIDLNRTGTGLMEIVSEPDMRSPEEAGSYVRTLQSLIRRIGASDGNMEQGSLRCDVNVSVNREGEDKFGTRCEIKNINSVRYLMAAIIYEIQRHISILSIDLTVPQETRGYDEDEGTTFRLRTKEDAPDYRYMPDPNLPPIILDNASSAQIDEIRSTMPSLISETRTYLQSHYGLSLRDVDALMSLDTGSDVAFDGETLDESAVNYFETVADGRDPKVVVNWILHDLLGCLAYRGETFQQNPISTSTMGELIDVAQKSIITRASGKTLLRHIIATKTNDPISTLIDALNLRSLPSNISIEDVCRSAIKDLPQESQSVRDGNEKAIGRIVGRVMKVTGGRADGKEVGDILKRLLNEKLDVS